MGLASVISHYLYSVYLFSGDLNYRKLLGDRQWLFEETTFDQGLNKFNPAPLLSLRTLKSDVCCGLKQGTIGKLEQLNKDWMVLGEYGVIQFTQTILPIHISQEKTTADSKQRVSIQSGATVMN